VSHRANRSGSRREKPAFEELLREGFAACGFAFDAPFGDQSDLQNDLTVVAAVSGGADSMALLTGVNSIAGAKKNIVAFTLDHAMREESGRDVLFVDAYCKKLGIVCRTARLARGEVDRTAEMRGMGREEAARYLRYKAFDDVLAVYAHSVLCLAHTRDDNLETILMRFLQSASSSASWGIPAQRKRFMRPMLNITRKQVLEYLDERGVSFCVDSTNEDTAFFRNKIRHSLIPVLDERFAGWQKAVLSGAQKRRDDGEAVAFAAGSVQWSAAKEKGKTSFFLPLALFLNLPRAARRELLYNAWDALFNEPGLQSKGIPRLPYETVSRVCDGLLPARVNGIVFERQSANIVMRNEAGGEGGFFALIENEGMYALGDLMLRVSKKGSGVRVPLPVCVRQPLSTDSITFKTGERALASLFSSAKIPLPLRKKIPVVEKNGKIAAVMASAVGYHDWLSLCTEQLKNNSLGAASSVEGNIAGLAVEGA
jgi:tRNA(Ile)-lysidine synthase